MIARLNENDINFLKYQTRMGFVLPILFFLLASFIGCAIYEMNFNISTFNLKIDLLIALISFLISSFISFLMNRNIYLDIENNEKIGKIKILQRKIAKQDWEAGSGNMTSLPHDNPMIEFNRYDFIIDNIQYRVKSEMFNKMEEGDELILWFSPKTGYLLSIEKQAV